MPASILEGTFGIGLSGPIAAGPSEVSCHATLFENSLFGLNATVYYVHSGPGTISIDFGNSLLAEVRLNTDSGVPEPSTLWLLSAIIPVAIYKRHQVRSQPSTAH